MLELLNDAARTAGAAVVLSACGCLMVSFVALAAVDSWDELSERAFALARAVAVLGGTAGLVGAVLAVAYRWKLGDVAFDTAVLAEAALLGLLALWAVVAAAMIAGGEPERSE